MRVFAWIVVGLLLLFTVRRYLYWIASLLPPKSHAASRTRTISVLVAARNEASLLPRLLAALDRLDYPGSLLRFVLVDDGSTDSTGGLMREWTKTRTNALALSLPLNSGKARALEAALSVAPASELVAVLDADTEPEPDALAWLAGAFNDSRVGAACGYPRPGNADASVASRYAAMERWVFHLVTLAGKDRMGMNPPAIGALCMIRREALSAIGGFPTDAVAEDICVSVELVKRGWRTRWIREAVTREDAADDVSTFRRQRQRWSRGLLASGSRAGGFEDLIVALGYLDRLVFSAAVILAATGWIPAWLPASYAVAPLISVVTALWRAGIHDPLPFVSALPPMIVVDLAVTAASVLTHVRGMPVRWTERPARPDRTDYEALT